MSDPTTAELAHRLIQGDVESVIATLAAHDPALAGAVSREAGARLWTHAREVPFVDSIDELEWFSAQRTFRHFATTEGADVEQLAIGLLVAAISQEIRYLQPVSMQEALQRPGLEPEAALWIAETAPAYLRSTIDPATSEMAGTNTSHVRAALVRAEGPEAANWLIELVAIDDWGVETTFGAMQRGDLPRWSEADWITKFTALADSDVPIPRFIGHLGLGDPPPKVISSSLARFVLTRLDDPANPIFRLVQRLFTSWRTGDPGHDATLFWWPDAAAHVPAVRALVQFSAVDGAAAPVFDAAERMGLLPAELLEEMRAPVDRPPWVDGDVRWTIEPTPSAHEIHVPDGRLAVGDPIWGEGEESPVEVDVPPGRYEARVYRATHPLRGRANVGAEVIVDAEAEATEWRAAPGVSAGSFGVGNGLAVIGPPGFSSNNGGGLEVEMANVVGTAVSYEISREPDGTGLVCDVRPQHHEVQSWVGLDAGGHVVRLISEFGILDDLDPTARPLPW